MTEEYRLVIRIKNNLLYTKMKARGIETQAELARVVDSSPVDIGEIANLKVGAYSASGKLTASAKRLCDYFGCLPEDIFPAEVLYEGIPQNVVERGVSSLQIARQIQQDGLDPAHLLEDKIPTQVVPQLMKRLKPREQRVITGRFFEGKTSEELSKELNISASRVRQMERDALWKLKSVVIAAPGDLYLNHDSTPAGQATALLDSIAHEKAKKLKKVRLLDAMDRKKEEILMRRILRAKARL